MTHKDLVIAAEKWLLKAKGCGFAFAEFAACTGNGETPDAIGWRSGYSILCECKASRSDFLADKKKRFRKNEWQGMGDYRFFVCPDGLIKPEELPNKWGLVTVSENGKAKQIVGPKGNYWTYGNGLCFRFEEKSHMAEMDMMKSALRRLHLRGVLGMIYERPFQED